MTGRERISLAGTTGRGMIAGLGRTARQGAILGIVLRAAGRGRIDHHFGRDKGLRPAEILRTGRRAVPQAGDRHADRRRADLRKADLRRAGRRRTAHRAVRSESARKSLGSYIIIPQSER
jgi:hypothetical protein